MVPGRCIIAAVWIDTHCHLDAAEFDADRDAVVAAARAAGVATIVLPAVDAGNFDRVRELAHRHGLAYALGIHPMCTGAAGDADLAALRDAARGPPRRPAAGGGRRDRPRPLRRRPRPRAPGRHLRGPAEAGPRVRPAGAAARRAGRSTRVLKQLRTRPVRGGIAHAFNGSEQQAGAFVELGFKLGFGGALTFDRALRIRRVAAPCRWRPSSGDRRPGHRRRSGSTARPRRGPPGRRCATTRPSCRASAPRWPGCAAIATEALAAATTAQRVRGAAAPRRARGARGMSAAARPFRGALRPARRDRPQAAEGAP